MPSSDAPGWLILRKAMLGCTALFLLLGGAALQAAAPRADGGDSAQRQARIMLQQIAAEKTALQKQNAELTGTVADLEARIKKLETETKKRNAELDTAQRNNDGLRARVERDSDRYKDLSEKHGATTSTLRDARADIQLLQNAVQEREQWIADCQAKNEGMYKTNMDLLSAYRDKGALDALAQHEPVTGLGLIKVENAVQEFQFRLEDLRTLEFKPDVAAQEARTAQ